MDATSRGFSLVEVLLALAIFSVFSTGIIGAIIFGRESVVLSGNRDQALFLADEGLEAARNIRDAGFTNLSDGTYGLATTSNQWAFNGSSDKKGIFTQQVTVSTVDPLTKLIVSTVTWQQDLQRTGSISLSSYLTNQTPPSSGLAINISGAGFNNNNKTLQGITVQNTTAQDITVTQIQMSWAPDAHNRTLNSLTLGGKTVWSSGGTGSPSGAQHSGTTMTLKPYTIPAGGTVPFTAVFGNPNNGNTFTITFFMSDGSKQTVITSLLN